MLKQIIDNIIYSKALTPFMTGIALATLWFVFFPNGEFTVIFLFFIVGLTLILVRYWYWANSIEKKWELHTATDFDICLYTSLTDEVFTWTGVGIATGLLGSVILNYLQIDSHPTIVLVVAGAIAVGNIGRGISWTNKGVALGELGKYQEAIECYDKAIKINTRSILAWANKGAALCELGKYQEAIECCNKAIKIDPRYFLAWTNKGVALGELGKYQEAIECYDKALEINPRYFLACYNKGNALDNLGKHQEAIECFEKSIEFAPPQYASQVERAKQIINQLRR